MRRIVVGVDGSEGSKAALRWAYEEARRWGVCLEAVHAWLLPATADVSGMATATDLEPHWRSARDLLSSAVTDVVGDASDVRVLETVIEGTAAEHLVGAATDADLLVVGSRGRGRVSGPLLGSVSQQCTHQAPCPVVVISPEARLSAA